MIPSNADRQYRGFSLFTYHVLVAVVVVGLALLLWRIAGALLLAFVGVLLAAALRGAARLLGRYLRVPTEWAPLPVAIVLIAAVSLFVWFASPRINAQLAQLIKTLPGSIQQIEEQLKQYPWGQYILSHLAGPAGPASQGFHLVTRLPGIASAAFTVLADLIIIIIFTPIYLAINPDTYRRGIVSLVPPALVILAVASLGLLFGLLGALVATPLVVVILVWVKMLYVQDVLGKSIDVK